MLVTVATLGAPGQGLRLVTVAMLGAPGQGLRLVRLDCGHTGGTWTGAHVS